MKTLTQKQLADAIGVAPRTVRRWHREGMPRVVVKRRPRYRPEDVNRWLDRNSLGGGRVDKRVK